MWLVHPKVGMLRAIFLCIWTLIRFLTLQCLVSEYFIWSFSSFCVVSSEIGIIPSDLFHFFSLPRKLKVFFGGAGGQKEKRKTRERKEKLLQIEFTK